MTLEKSRSTEKRVPEVGADGAIDPPLRITVSHTEDRTRVDLKGELDDSTVLYLEERLFAIAANLMGDLVLDIGSLTFLDSTALSLFISQHKRLRSQGSKLVISSPTPMARRILQITGLTQILAIEPSEQPRREMTESAPLDAGHHEGMA